MSKNSIKYIVSVMVLFLSLNLSAHTQSFNLHQINALKNPVQKTNIIYWTTADEINGTTYEIQRSFNKYEWSTMVKIDGFGNNNDFNQYEWIDHSMEVRRKSPFYRIKIKDYENTEYFTIAIPIENDNPEFFNTQFVHAGFGNSTLVVNSPEEEAIELEIYLNNVIIYKNTLNCFTGYNEFMISDQILKSTGNVEIKINSAHGKNVYTFRNDSAN